MSDRVHDAVRRANDRWDHRGDEGLSLIECVVAIALLVIVLLPTTLFIINGQQANSSSHLIAEANTIASQALNEIQAEGARNDLPGGFQAVAYSIDEVGQRKTKFTVDTTWTTIRQGTNKDICAAGAVGPAQQIWLVTVSVSWPNMNGINPVTQTSEVSPGVEGGIQQGAGELAVTLDTTTAAGLAAFTTEAVTATITGTWNPALGPQPAVPSGEVTTDTETSAPTSGGDFDACLVFQDLDTQVGWTYVLSFAGNFTVAQAAEYADENQNGPYTTPVTLQTGIPSVMTVLLSVGTPVNVTYVQGPAGNCTTGLPLTAPPQTPSAIPVTVNNSNLTMYTNQDWVNYSTNTSTFSSMLLYSGYTSVTQIWAGSGQLAEPATPCTVTTTPGVPQNVDLDLYDLKLTVSGSPATMVATQQGGAGVEYTLNLSGAASSTDLPLGAYSLGDQPGGGGTVTPPIVWVTASGNCTAATYTGTPPSPCNTTTPMAVTAS